jgi:hypothetical protein
MALRKLQFSGELLLFERVEASPGSRHDAVDILASISVGKLLVEIGCTEATSNALQCGCVGRAITEKIFILASFCLRSLLLTQRRLDHSE